MVAFSAVRDPVSGTVGWGPGWIAYAIIIGAIAVAYAYWRIAVRIRDREDT